MLVKCHISCIPSRFNYVAKFTECGVWDSRATEVNSRGGGIAKALGALPDAVHALGVTRLGDVPCCCVLLLRPRSQGLQLGLPWAIFRLVYVCAYLVLFIRNISKIERKW